MKGSEHLNFHATDPNLGPALVSIKDVTTEEGDQLTLFILRLCIGTFQQVYLLSEVFTKNTPPLGLVRVPGRCGGARVYPRLR